MRLDTPLRTAVSGALTPPSAGTHKRGAGTSGPAVTLHRVDLAHSLFGHQLSHRLPGVRLDASHGCHRRSTNDSGCGYPFLRGGQTPKVRVWPRASVYRRPRYSSAKLK